jgi:hypothetical protein
MLALERAAGKTSSARAAGLGEKPHDVIADVDLRDVRAHSRRDSRDLVTKHRGCRDEVMGGEQEIRVTKARRLDVDEDLATSWRGDLHVFEIKPTAQRVRD